MDTFTIVPVGADFDVWKRSATFAKATFVHRFATAAEAQSFVANRRKLEMQNPTPLGGI